MQQWEVTKTADLVIINSAIAASVLKHGKQEPVHLLYALTMIGSDARDTLKKHGLYLETVRPAVLKLSLTSFIGDRRVIEVFSHDAVAIINDAIRMAREDDGRVAGPLYLLRALVTSGDENVMKVLSMLSVYPDMILRDVTEAIERLYG